MAQPTQADIDAAYAEYLANYEPPKKVGIIGGLGTALERAPDTIASQFKSMVGGLTNLNVNAIEAVPGLDFGQGALYTQPLRDDAAAATRSAQLDRAYQDYLNPMPQAGLGKYSAMLGDSLTQAIPALGAGLTTGGLGAAATMAGQYFGESRLSQLEENPNQPVREGRALASGLAQAGVDMTLGRFLGGNLNPVDNFTKGVFGTGIGGSATRGVVMGGLRGAAEEGTAEVIQQAIDRAQVGLDVNPFTSKGAADEYTQSFAMGALLGGGMGAVTGGIANAYDARKARQDSPDGIAQAFNNRESIGAEGRLKALMDEQAANQAYNQLNPSPFINLGEQLTAGGEFDNQRLANEIADARDAARLIEERKQGEFLQLPAPDPMKYDPSGVSGRPATQEEILMAQQTGGAPNVAPVLALPNPNVEPIVVDPAGVAQRTDEPLRVEQERAQEAIVSPDRDVQAAALVQQAATTKRTQSEPASPYDAKAMLTVRGKPAYTVTVVGPGSKPNMVKVFNNDTRAMVEVPRSRIASVTEARDPKVLNRLPSDIRRAEDARAKDLHQKQIEAIINPQSATEAVPPPADTVGPTQDLGVPPPTVAPDVQGEGSFVEEAPVAEMPQSIAPAVNVTQEAGQQTPAPNAPVASPPQQTSVAEMPQSFDAPVSQTETVSSAPAVDTLSPISAPPVEEASPYTPRQGLNVVEDAAEKAGPAGALRQLAERNPKYAPIANAVADRIEELQAVGATITLNIAGPGDPVPTRMVRNRDTFGMSMPDATNRRNDVYVAADSLGRYTNGSFDFDQVLLHEMIHAVTLAQIKSVFDQKAAGTVPSQGVKDLLSLFNEVVTHFNKRVKAGKLNETEVNLLGRRNQGLKDIYEFVAWGMTNPEFQQYLDTIPYSKTPRSMFSEFVNAVRAALGIPAKEKSTLTGLIRTFDKMMAEPAANVDRNMLRMQTALGRVADAQNQAAQATTGPAITNPDGPELAAAAEPMSTTDDDAVFAIQQVEQAALDPNFRSQVVIALREEFRKLGFGANIPLALEFTDAAGAAAMLKTQNGKQTIVIALGLANNTRDVPGAVQAMRPFLTHEVVEFAQNQGLLKPEERTVLLDYAKSHKGADGKTLYETVVERYGDLAKANNQPEAYLEREAVAYAAEYLTRLNPQKWGDSPQNPAASRRRRRPDPRAKNKPTAETKAANGFKDRIMAFGKALFKGIEKAYPAKTADGGTLAQDIALRLAKGDIAHRARTNPRFVQEVKFAGWAVPPAEVTQLGKQLRNYLDSMGLPDVGLRMATGILDRNGKTWTAAAEGTMGSYYARTITISMEAYNPSLSIEENLKNLVKIVDHEAVHALRATGAWSPSEWMNITKFVRMAKDPITNETYSEKAQRQYGAYTKNMSPAVAQDVLNEEAVAMAFADNFDIRIPRPTGPKRLLDRIAQVSFGLARALHATGRPSAEMLMANGNSVSAAVRAGVAAKNRRERGASSPAETAVKFALVDSKMANVNPAFDPDPDSVFGQLNDIDPINNFLEDSTRMIENLLGVRERPVPVTQKLPFARMFAPLAELEGHDAFKSLKGLTSGSIHELKETTSRLLEEGLALTNKNPAARDAVNAYLETKGADPYSPRLPNGAKNPAYIENKRLRDITVAAKERIRLHGRIAVHLGFISQESFDNLDGAYLHHMDITSDRKVINSQRFLLPDMSWTRKRRGLSEDERTLRGAVSNLFVSIGTYLSLSGEAFLIDRMYDHMIQWSEVTSQEGGRPWVLDTEHLIKWRGQDWSPAAVEAEIEFLRGDAMDMARPTGVPDAKHDLKMQTLERSLKESRTMLLRNPLWQKMHDTTPAEVAQMLGVDPAQADLSKLDGATVQSVYDSLLRRQQKTRNAPDGLAQGLNDLVGGGAKFIGNDYVEIPDTARWGRLRGMAVDRAIYDVMNATGAMFTKAVEDRAQVARKEDTGLRSLLGKVLSPEAYVFMMSTYKKVNTVFNPQTHGTNWIGNLIMFETMGGGLPGESLRYGYEAAKQLVAGGGPAFDIVRKYGGVQTGQLASEITTLTDPRIQAAIAEATDGFDPGDPKASGMALLRRIQAALNKVDDKLSNAYQLSDTFFRIAKVQMDLDRGLTETEAFLNAQDLYLDYTVVPNFIRFIRMMPFGSPFISWTYLSTGQFLDKLGSSAVISRSKDEFDENGEPKEFRIPHFFLMMPMMAVFMAMSSIFRADDFEEEDQKYLQVGLPKFTDGGTGLSFIGLDDQGRPVFFDWMKYVAGGTLARIAGRLDNIKESDNIPVGVGAIAQELGFGSDPATGLYQIWRNELDPNSGKPLSVKGTEKGGAIADQLKATADLFLPAILMPGDKNPVFGDYGITASLAAKDSPSIPYEQNRAALTVGQKFARLAGIGIFVTDPMPAMDTKVKEATRLRADVQGHMAKIYKDQALSPEARNQELLELEDSYTRLKEREEEAKAMQAEMAPFYLRLRQAAVERGALDPAISNAETMAARRQKTSQEDVEEALAVARGLQDAKN